jgi:hypothetical protein
MLRYSRSTDNWKPKSRRRNAEFRRNRSGRKQPFLRHFATFSAPGNWPKSGENCAHRALFLPIRRLGRPLVKFTPFPFSQRSVSLAWHFQRRAVGGL